MKLSNYIMMKLTHRLPCWLCQWTRLCRFCLVCFCCPFSCDNIRN